MRNKAARSRVGLDLGTNSAGWASIELDQHGNPCGLIDLGARIFSDGRNPKDGSSLAVQRRVPRGMRKRRDRYLERRTDLMNALIALGLMPDDETERKGLEALDPYALRARAIDHPLKPHELGRALFHLAQRRGFKSNRKAGGKEKEDGVISEGIKTLSALMGKKTLGQFLHALNEENKRNKNGKGVRARPDAGFYPDRKHYIDEFDAVQGKQQAHHTLRPDQWDSLKDIIFYQRPLKPVDPGWCLLEDGERRAHRALPCAQDFRILQELANLRIAPKGERAVPLTKAQRDKVLHQLRTKKEVKLDSLLKLLKLPDDTHVNLLGEDRKALKGDESAVRLSSKGIFDKAWHTMPFERRTEIVRTLLDTEKPEDVERIAREQWSLDDEAAEKIASLSLPEGYVRLSEKAINKLNPIMEDQGLNYSEAVAECPDYAHHSDFRPDKAHDHLPYYGAVLTRQVVGGDVKKSKDDEAGHYGRIANPTVHIGLGQMRRVINKIIAVHGKPSEIVVELSRDLKMNAEEKAAERRKIRENQEANERRTKDYKSSWLESQKGKSSGDLIEQAPDLSPHFMRKVRLWEEQQYGAHKVCPFTGDPISYAMVISDETEIEHILPFSKTLDDSMANKVLALREVNRVKRDRSPYDAFHNNPTEGKRKYNYEEMLLRADSLPRNKRWRFHPDAMDRFKDEPEFLDRQLNENKYLSRIARQYLAHLYNEKAEKTYKVRAIPGRLTAMLRAKWGLNALLRDHNRNGGDEDGSARKNRDNHLHHAIDAFVIAMTDQGLLQKISELNRDPDRTRLIDEIPQPWEGFTPDALRPHLDRLVVSHKPDHGTFPWMAKKNPEDCSNDKRQKKKKGNTQTSGSLHNDTAYGLVAPGKNGNWKVVSRAPLSGFTTPEALDKALPDIRDRALREALTAEWIHFQKHHKPDAEGDPDDKRKKKNPAMAFAEYAANTGIKLGGKTVKVRRVRMTEELDIVIIKDRKTGKPYKAYKPDGNAFADLYELPDGKWKAVVVRRFDANQPDFDPVKFRPHPAAKKLWRLHIDDMVAVGEGDARRILRIVKMSGQTVTMADHFEGGALKARDADKSDIFKYFAPSASRLKDLGFRKVGVDEIGRLADPGPRKARPAP